MPSRFLMTTQLLKPMLQKKMKSLLRLRMMPLPKLTKKPLNWKRCLLKSCFRILQRVMLPLPR